MAEIGKDLQKASELLRNGKLVGMPTETVYGLAACIDQDPALQLIFSTKKRPFFDPLIVHVSNIDQAKKLFKVWSPTLEVLTKKFWPGALTLVSEKSHQVSDLITSGLPTVAVRMPDHPMALSLIQSVGVPLAAPSANRFGKTSPSQAAHVQSEFPDQDIYILDGGACQIGIESTVLSVSEDGLRLSVFRKGSVRRKDIEIELQKDDLKIQWQEAQKSVLAPGMMKHHYMPEKPLIIVNGDLMSQLSDMTELYRQMDSGLLSLEAETEGVTITRLKGPIKLATELTLSNDGAIAARELYAKMREAALSQCDVIYFRLNPKVHLSEEWSPVWDRLLKASHLRLGLTV